MAIQFTLICDGCGEAICSTRHSERGTRSAAQLECGAFCNREGDFCRSCRRERTRLTAGNALAGAPSVGTHR